MNKHKKSIDKNKDKDIIEIPHDILIYKKVKHYSESAIQKRRRISNRDRFQITKEIIEDYGLETPSTKRFKETFVRLKGMSGARIKDLSGDILMSTGYVSDLLRGKSNPDMYIIERIAFFFGLPPTHFLEYRLGLLIRELRKCPVMISIFYDMLTSGKFNVKK